MINPCKLFFPKRILQGGDIDSETSVITCHLFGQGIEGSKDKHIAELQWFGHKEKPGKKPGDLLGYFKLPPTAMDYLI